MKHSLLLVAFLTATSLVAQTPQELQESQLPMTIENLGNANSGNTQNAATNDTKMAAVEGKLTEIESEMALMRLMNEEQLLKKEADIRISVIGQGVAPMKTTSPAQAYALARRAATADAYRLVAEKVKGVRIDGQDLIKNMMIQRSTIRTSVNAMVRNANIVESTFKEGLCEVEMEVVLSYSEFAQ